MDTSIDSSKALGMDISAWQEGINWSKVAAAGVPLSFCFIKASEGTAYASPEFAGQWEGCQSLSTGGVKPLRGAYHYYLAKLDGRAQAQWFLQKAKKGELPPSLDLEDDAGLPLTSTAAQIAAAAAGIVAFVNTVSDAWGQKVLIYSGPWFWNRLAEAAPLIPGLCEYWGATYRASAQAPDLAKGWSAWRFWQFTSAAKVSGIPGTVDLDTFNGTQAELLAWAGVKETGTLVTPPGGSGISVDLSLEGKVAVLWEDYQKRCQ